MVRQRVSPAARLSWGLGEFLELRVRLLQPKAHVHLAVHGRRGGEVILRFMWLARAPGNLAEAEVAVGDQRAHAELAGERQRLAVVASGILGAACRRDVTDEAEGVGLACPSPQPAGERQCLSGVAGGLVDPPGREVGYPRAQKNERWPDVSLATVELLDGARDQRERLVGAAGEGVGGAEGRGDARYSDDELPRSAEVVAPLENPDRAWQIPTTEEGAAEIEQPEVQRPGMIGRFSDLHRSLGVPDGLVEPAKL